MTAFLINHLWQSTLFALGAGLLTMALKGNGARFRHGVWFVASVKFLVPFALLGMAGGWILHRLHPLPQPPAGLLVVRQVVEPFTPPPPAAHSAVHITARAAAPMIVAPNGAPVHLAFPSTGDILATVLLAIWALGVAMILVLWVLRWRRVRGALIASSPLDLPAAVPARASPSLLEPGVIGIFSQVVIFPQGIEKHLSAAELDAVLAHELQHVRRRDNLTAAIHMLVEALFWFHPVVWWIGARLLAERERACDEGVIATGADPQVYAEGILKVCRFYLQSPLACAAGVSGSNLKQRMEMIMTGSKGAPLGLGKTLLLSGVAVLAIAAPVATGLIAAAPAAARTAALEKAGVLERAILLAPAQKAVAPVVSEDHEPAPTAANPRPLSAIVQGLRQEAELATAPGQALVAAIQLQPATPPELQLAALTTPPPSPALPPPTAGCRLGVLASFRVDPRAYVPVIGGEINRRRVQFIVGVSSRTAIYRSALKTLDVFEEGRRQQVFSPVPMEIGYGWVRDLELDGMPPQVLSRYDVHENFGVSVVDGGAGGLNGPAAVLGAQFWALADEDFDLRAGSISLVRPSGCAGGDTLPFNGGAYSQTRMLTPPTAGISDEIAVIVDGAPMRALIDTSIAASFMTRQGATKLGRGWPLPNAQPLARAADGGQAKILWSLARFKTLSIGEETIQNPRIPVGDVYDRGQELQARSIYGYSARPPTYTRPDVTIPDMVLGADFFHAHHVLIANSRRTVYFAYNGAPLFQ